MPTYVLAGTVGGQATVTGALRRIKILAGSISATVTFAAVKLKLWQALKGVIRAVCAVPGQLRLKWQVFTVNAGGTMSNELHCSNYGLYSLEISPAMTGSTIIVHARNRSDQALVPLYTWVGGTKTQVKITTGTVNDTLFFDYPLNGLYSMALELPTQSGHVVITPRWGRM